MAIYFGSSIQNISNWKFWSRKNKCITKLIRKQNIDVLAEKSYLCTKDLNELKYQLLI